MLFLVQLVLLFISVASAKVIDINEETDRELISLDRKLTERGLGIRIFPYRHKDEAGPHGGVVIGLNSIMRTGNCTLIVDGHGVEDFDFHLGFRLLSIANGKIRYKGDIMSGITAFNKNSFHLSFTVKNFTDSCTVILGNNMFEKLDDVMFFGSLEKYDGTDITKFANKYILPRINTLLEREKPRIQEKMQESICKNLGTSIDDVLNVFLDHHYNSNNHVNNYMDNSID